jgi:hypothetical protein
MVRQAVCGTVRAAFVLAIWYICRTYFAVSILIGSLPMPARSTRPAAGLLNSGKGNAGHAKADNPDSYPDSRLLSVLSGMARVPLVEKLENAGGSTPGDVPAKSL